MTNEYDEILHPVNWALRKHQIEAEEVGHRKEGEICKMLMVAVYNDDNFWFETRPDFIKLKHKGSGVTFCIYQTTIVVWEVKQKTVINHPGARNVYLQALERAKWEIRKAAGEHRAKLVDITAILESTIK